MISTSAEEIPLPGKLRMRVTVLRHSNGVLRASSTRSLSWHEVHRSIMSAHAWRSSTDALAGYSGAGSEHATNISAKGASFGSLEACAAAAVGRVQTQQAPDVGTVHVVAVIAFRPT